MVVFLVTCLVAAPVKAFQGETPVDPEQPLQITIDMAYTTVKTGDKVQFNTVIKNNGSIMSPPLIQAMNIINLNATGDVVDPEDWSPQRTQYLNGLLPGASVTLPWTINTILDGDFMVYMVLLPEPESQDSTSRPVASPGIHLTVTPFTRLNPGGVLPYVIGGPLLLLLGTVFIFRMRRRAIDTGASS